MQIHEHIIIHGNITKPTKINVAGMELETETMVEADDDEGVNQGTRHLANRESFLLMKERMQKQVSSCVHAYVCVRTMHVLGAVISSSRSRARLA